MSKPFSISLGAKRPSSTPLTSSQRGSQPSSKSSTPKPGVFEASKSSRSKFYHDDSEGEDEHPPTHEEVTAFDRSAGGAISKNRRETEKAPLVIKVDSKNNWRDRVSRATKSWLPPEVQAQRAAQKAGVCTNEEVDVEGPSTKHGLSFAQSSAEAEGGKKTTAEDIGDTKMTDVDAPEAPSELLTQEEQALQALISESRGEEGSGRKSNMVIEGKPTNGWSTEVNETNSFRTDVDSRPEPASLADYAAVPVEEFGAALLRGMGWKEGEPVNKGRYGDTVSTQTALKARVPERRPGYLGIGAKDISGKAGSAELELGAWGKSAMRKAKKPGEGLYTPVLMRSKKSGEMVTEDEFKALQKEGQDKPDEWKARRDRNLEKYGRDRRSRDDDDGDSDRPRRSGYSSRNASASPDREKRRRKDYDDENSHRKSDGRRYRDRSHDSNRDLRDRDRDEESRWNRDRGRDHDSDRDRRKSSRRFPEEESSRHRSSRRRDPDRARERSRDRRDRHRDSSRDRR